MGQSINWWEEEAKKLSPNKLANLIDALNKLATWKAFSKEYKWTGIYLVRLILRKVYHDKTGQVINLVEHDIE